MTKYVTTNGSGNPTGFFDTATGVTVPAGAIAISNAQFSALIAAPTTTTVTAGTGGAPATLGSSSAPAASTPLPAVQAQMALGNGLAIISTAHSGALNGTYALDSVTMSLAADLAAAINANSGAFPASASTWKWPDASGTLHTFPSAAEFLAFQSALALYRLELYAVIWGVSGTLPAATATIA